MPPDALERSVPQLKDPTLLRQQAYIDGRWVDADNGATMRVVNPGTGALVGTAPDMGAAFSFSDRMWAHPIAQENVVSRPLQATTFSAPNPAGTNHLP